MRFSFFSAYKFQIFSHYKSYFDPQIVQIVLCVFLWNKLDLISLNIQIPIDFDLVCTNQMENLEEIGHNLNSLRSKIKEIFESIPKEKRTVKFISISRIF